MTYDYKKWSLIDTITSLDGNLTLLTDGPRRFTVATLASYIQDLAPQGILLTERSSDPDDPTEGTSIIWQSDGTGLGDDGDLLAKITAAGVTIDTKITDYVAIPCNVGGYNHVEIQAALDAGKRVILDGNYYIQTTITIPAGGAIIGIPGSMITYYPSPFVPSSNYAIIAEGDQRTFPALQNITIACSDKGRGVYFKHIYYSPLYENLRVFGSYEVGVDIIDCWGSTAGELYLSSTDGIGVRVWRGNSTRLGMIYATATESTNMPSATETEIQDRDANDVQTAANRQALIVIDSNCHGTTIDNLTLESSLFTGPLVTCDGSSCTVNYLYLEGNACTDAVVTCVGDGDRQGAALSINGGEIINQTTSTCLLDLSGTTRSVQVRRFLSLAANGFTDSIIRLSGGTHHEPQVIDCHITGMNVEDYIEEAGGTFATSANKTLLSISERSSNAPNPPEGQSSIWQSDGTALGDDGDLLVKFTAGGVTYTTTITDYVAIPVNSGGYNHVEIQAALDAGKVVLLDGSYNISTTITIPPSGAIIGTPGTSITIYPSPDTPSSAYMIYVEATLGNKRTMPAIQNILLNARGKHRGVHFDQIYESPLYDNLRLYNTYEVGIDVIDCTGCSAGSLFASTVSGIAARFWKSSGSKFDFIFTTLCNSTNMPSASDTSVQDLSASYVQTAVARQALLVVADNNNLLNFGTVVLKSNTFTTVDLISCDGAVSTIDALYVDGNSSTDSIISVVGDGDKEGAVFTINSGQAVSQTSAACLLDLTGTTRSVQVRRFLSLTATGFSDSIIRLTSGTHYDVQVKDCHVTGAANVNNSGATRLVSGYDYIGAPTALTDTDVAISTTNLFNGIMQMTTTAARYPYLPSGTTMNSVIRDIGGVIRWTFCNTGTYPVTIKGASGHTIVGKASIKAGHNGTFITRLSAANTAITYRIDAGTNILFATGDTTTNTSNLNTALSEASYGDTIFIEGNYLVNSTVTIPNQVTLAGFGNTAGLSYVGTTDSSLYVVITSGGRLRDIYVGCDYRRRGIQIATPDARALSNVYVYNPVAFGIVASNSYGSLFSVVRVVGYPAHASYSTCVPIYGTSLNSTLWQNIGISFNDCSDTNQHAIQIVSSNDVEMHNILIQSNDCGGNAPMIVTDCNVVSLYNLRFEDNETSTVNLSVTGSTSAYSKPVRIIGMSNAVDGQTTPPYAIGLYTNSQAVIEDVWANSSHIATGVVYCDSGTHVIPEIRNFYSDLPYLTIHASATIAAAPNKYQPAPALITDGDTAISTSDLQSQILYMISSGSARAPYVPTGTEMNGIVPLGNSIQWTFINTGSQVVTITNNTAHTLVGDMTLAAGESGTFITRVASANTAVTYRL